MSLALTWTLRTRAVVAALAVYCAAVGVIVLWPTHVDRGATPFVHAVLRAVPFLSYDGLETLSNVMLFTPLGVLGALLVREAAMALVVVPFTALAVSALIETAQADLLPGRTGDVADVLADTLGAVLGCVAVVLVRRASRPAHADVPPARRAPRRGVEAVAAVHHDAARRELRGVLG